MSSITLAGSFNLPVSWILTNDGTSIDQNKNGYPDYADGIFNVSAITVNDTNNLNGQQASYYLNYDNMNSGSISSIYIDDSNYWDAKAGTGACPNGYYINGTNTTGVICEQLPAETIYTAGDYLYKDSNEFNVNNTELNDNILIKYQNITNIPTCTSDEKLIFNGTDLICDNDKEGSDSNTNIIDENLYNNSELLYKFSSIILVLESLPSL